jgi:hypothetical protein
MARLSDDKQRDWPGFQLGLNPAQTSGLLPRHGALLLIGSREENLSQPIPDSQNGMDCIKTANGIKALNSDED